MSEIHHFRDDQVVLYKRDDTPKWQARVKLPTGKWHRFSTKQIDLDEAKKMACEEFDQIRFRDKNNLSFTTKRFTSVAKATKKELQEQLDSGYGKVSFSHYISVIDRYLIPFFGNINIDSIDYKKLKEFDQWRVAKLGRVPKKSTINNHNAALQRVFALALNNNWIHPLQVPDLKNTGTKTERRPSFTRQEYQELYRFMRTWHKEGIKEVTRQIRTLLRDYVLILANTGMRHGTESTRLKWKNIEELEVDGKKYLRFWVNGKTGKRELIANPYVQKYLKRIQGRFADLRDLSPSELYKVDEYVFRLENGDRPKDWHGSFEVLLRDAGMLDDRHGSRRTLYSLRHTYATFRLMKGVSIHILAKNMGTSVGMIEQHYSHLIPSMSAAELTGMKRNRD